MRGDLGSDPAAQRSIIKPSDWRHYAYPFIYGQFDAVLVPTREGRECCTKSLRAREIRDWAQDARNILASRGADMVGLPVDGAALQTDSQHASLQRMPQYTTSDPVDLRGHNGQLKSVIYRT